MLTLSAVVCVTCCWGGNPRILMSLPMPILIKLEKYSVIAG